MAESKQGRGERIGRYVVVDTIGVGAMGTVHAAFDPELARTVALKVVRPQAALRVGAHGLRMRLLREAQAMARVVHPNVVPIFDVGQQGDRLYLAMERIEGVNLRRWLARGQPPFRALLDVLVPAGRGLAAAHREGIVHRDFKPENVLVGAHGRICVTDFGLARPSVARPDAPAVAAMPGLLGVTLTLEGERIGTPAYMAPEQHRGEPADPRSDLYAFCVVLYEGLYGRRPDEPREARPPLAVPLWLQRIVARGLADDPAQRFASMDALLAEIERHQHRRRSLLRRGGVVVLSLAAVGLALAGQPSDDAAEQPCETAEASPAAAWNDAARSRVRVRFEAQADRRHVMRVLDDRVAAWQVTEREVCEATWTRGEQSPELFDARMRCLHDASTRMRHAIDLLAEADAGVIAHARALVDGMPPPDRCGAIDSDEGPPDDAAARERWVAARDAVAKADALRLAGRTAEAHALLRPVLPVMRELDRPALLGAASIVLARLDRETGDLEAARKLADEALRLARLARRPELEADAWIALSEASDDPGHARFCARMALATIEAAGGNRWLEARAVALAPPR